jgi:filamentous hemagglutinin family protein
MSTLLCRLPRIITSAILGLLWPLGVTQAEISLDGSLGPAGELSGPDFQISADLGQQMGSNLFHSFGVFNLNAGESATFTPQGSMGPISNVLGRVTGGSPSNIDGLLRSTIPGANLFLLNSAGILFGPNASLDVQGSFHASTADYIGLGDGARFTALPSAQDAVLTTAAPEAFGFFEGNPAKISIQNSKLDVPQGEALSVVGGNIAVRNGSLTTPGGTLQIASTAISGEVPLATMEANSEQPAKGNAISITDSSLLDASGEGGGTVLIRGGPPGCRGIDH